MLVGDDRQLPEIEAGGAFSALADALDAAELKEVRRQDRSLDVVNGQAGRLTVIEDGRLTIELDERYVAVVPF